MRRVFGASLIGAVTASTDFEYAVSQLNVDLSAFTESERNDFEKNFDRLMRSGEASSNDLKTLLEMAEPLITEKKVSDLKEKINKSWEVSTNERFEGWSRFDVSKLMGTFMGDKAKKMSTVYEATNDVELPENFDSRQQWGDMCPSVLHVRDQATCGSCWAFGSTEAFTDRTCIATKGAKKEALATQHTTSCCGIRDCFSFGCQGGNPSYAWQWFADHGIVTGGDYQDTDTCWPYEIKPCAHHVHSDKYPDCPDHMDPTPKCENSCTNSQYTNPFKEDIHKADKAYQIEGVRSIKEAIFKQGPVTAAFTVYDDFPAYKTGVYVHTPGSKELGGHAIKIVGWGVEDGVDYWLVANSWNETWGDGGFFKIKQGECGINDNVSGGTVAGFTGGSEDEEEFM